MLTYASLYYRTIGRTHGRINYIYFHDGFRSSNSYQEHPPLLIQDFLKRQRSYVIATNKRLFKMSQRMVIEQAKLELEPTTFTTCDLKKAASKLNLISYKRYKAHQKIVSDYSIRENKKDLVI